MWNFAGGVHPRRTWLRQWLAIAVAILAAVASAGCGSSSVPFGQVDGRVTMGGQPVAMSSSFSFHRGTVRAASLGLLGNLTRRDASN